MTMRDDEKKVLLDLHTEMIELRRQRGGLASRLESALKEIEELTKERDFFKKTLAINHLLDQKGAEILGKMVATASKTICADCGKPSGDRHSCPEQASANQKAQREMNNGD